MKENKNKQKRNRARGTSVPHVTCPALPSPSLFLYDPPTVSPCPKPTITEANDSQWEVSFSISQSSVPWRTKAALSARLRAENQGHPRHPGGGFTVFAQDGG
jgi:hypothetical protein